MIKLYIFAARSKKKVHGELPANELNEKLFALQVLVITQRFNRVSLGSMHDEAISLRNMPPGECSIDDTERIILHLTRRRVCATLPIAIGD